MKVCHICLSNFFIDGLLYQENELVMQHLADGHDVNVIASTETHDAGGRVSYTTSAVYMGVEGAKITRLKYRSGLPHSIARKLRMHAGVYEILRELAPDAILFHGSAGWELITVARYVRAHPGCTFYVDSHTDANNSARNWWSKHILHRYIYRPILKSALQFAGPLLCVSKEVMEFAASVYEVPRQKLEFYPLGGHPVGNLEYFKLRGSTREHLNLSPDDILFVQSGKQTHRKMLVQAIEAFIQVKSSRFRFAIAGVLDEDIRAQVEMLLASDSRIVFLGWQDGQSLTALLCAADVYVQPGTQSATMQHSMCCRCAVILADVPSHEVYKRANGWFVSRSKDLRPAFEACITADLKTMGENSHIFACENLDYKVLAQRIFKPTDLAVHH